MSKPKNPNEPIKILVQNKKARFNYEILDTFEAGIVLTGAEIKSVREGEVSIQESFIRPFAGELYWIGAHIQPYAFSSAKDYDPVRKRKLLLHKSEIHKLQGRVETKGLTIVPLKLYLKNGRAKLEIGLARGKAAPDKRDSIKKREATREMARAVKSASKGGK